MKFSEFRRYTPVQSSHVYVFICEDDFLIEESKPVWAAIFGGDWGFEKLSAKEFEAIDSSELMELGRTPPLFGPSRALLVTGAGKVTKKRLADIQSIVRLEKSSLKIILVASSRRSIASRASGLPVIEINSLRAGDTVRWLRDRYGVSAEVGRYLVDNLGTELQQLYGEMEKLKTYLRDAGPPEMADVDQLIFRSGQYGPFELGDAFLAKDYPRAVRVVSAMVEEGVEPILILSRIVRVWRQIFVGKVLAGQRSAKEVAAAASVPHWKAPEFVAACRNFRWERVVKGFRELIQADRAFKTSSPNPEFYFDVMLWKLMR